MWFCYNILVHGSGKRIAALFLRFSSVFHDTCRWILAVNRGNEGKVVDP